MYEHSTAIIKDVLGWHLVTVEIFIARVNPTTLYSIT